MIENKYVSYKRKKRSKLRRASEGMTAAIILIAFIITAAGIAFVILTMGSEMQLELGNVGQEGKDAASSALQVEGGIVTGYSTAGTTVTGFAFNVKLVLPTGQVDLSSDAITVWLKIGSDEEVECTYEGAAFSTLAAAGANNDDEYYIGWPSGSGDVITSSEMARFYVSATTANGAIESEDVVIILNTGVATLKITKTIPIGLVTGVNLL
ncbi:hypothetical protein [Candidatus Lokiarchaeum ossiferum]